MKLAKKTTLLMALVFASSLFAEPCIEVGKPLPLVNFDGTGKVGEVVYQDDAFQYLDWSSGQLKGKTFLVYHLAARMGIDKVNHPFITRLDRLKLEEEAYLHTTVLNIDDVFFAGGGFARKAFQKNKVKHEEASFVLDDGSIARQAWCLNEKSSTVILLGPDGNVVHFKDGALNDDEIEMFYQSIKRLTGAEELPPGVITEDGELQQQDSLEEEEDEVFEI